MSMQALFYPQTIAVIGASSQEKTPGNDVVKHLVTQGYTGKVIPINPKIDELYGLPVVHDISEVTDQVDLAVVIIPAKFVPQALAGAAATGAQAAIVISAGFKEVGNKELENQVVQVCQQHNITLVGPNCLGIINPDNQMNASFASIMPHQGSIAFLSQSGALCASVLDYATSMGLGFSKFMSIGNKADLDELALIEYFQQDEQTKVIAIYAEALEDAPRFISTLKKMNRSSHPKPVIILKSGRTAEGAGAIASHTGSLAGGDAAYEALFHQAGVIRASTIQELFDMADVFIKNPLTAVENVTVITNAGGPGVLTTDAVIRSGLKLTQLSEQTVTELKSFLSPAASTHNPVDILGDALAETYRHTLEIVARDEQTDAIQIILTPQSVTEVEATAQAIVQLRPQINKPLVVSFMGDSLVAAGVKLLREADISVTSLPEPASSALAAMGKFAQFTQNTTDQIIDFSDVDQEKVRHIFEQAKTQGQTSFPEAQAMAIFEAYHFPLLKSAPASSAEEAARVVTEFGTEVAMKIMSPDILHKSDVGGVMLQLTAENVGQKFNEMMHTVHQAVPEARLEGVLLMEMAAPNGVETIVGVSKVPGLGTMIMFGMGGIYVEVLKDVNFAFAPVSQQEARQMVESLRMSAVFHGVRGQQPLDVDQIVDSIGRLSQLVTDFPEIVELDMNPLLVLPIGQGVKVLDGRVILEHHESTNTI